MSACIFVCMTKQCTHTHQTGYEWSKYNQTHYDYDNPPPKVVQVRTFWCTASILLARMRAVRIRVHHLIPIIDTQFLLYCFNQHSFNPLNPLTQGYKFNILYHDLIDKSKAPQYVIEEDPESADRSTCFIRFKVCLCSSLRRFFMLS